MSNSKVIYDAGGQSPYNVPFPYISTQHVFIYDNGVPYVGTPTWLTPDTLQLVPDILDSHTVEIRRTTPTTPLRTYSPGPVSTRDLNLTVTQLLYIDQENQDNAGTGGGGGGGEPGGPVAWTDITGKPGTFPPSGHTHPISQVTGLQTALDAKALVDLSNVSTANKRAAALAAGSLLLSSGEGGVALPDAATRANKSLGFDNLGAPVVLTPAGGTGGSVDTVNNIAPDLSGNVTLTATDVGAAAINLANTTLQPAASAEVQSAALILNRKLTLLKFIPSGLHAAILNGTSTANIAAYLQEALDECEARGGDELEVDRGLFRIATNIYVPSKTKLKGLGAASRIKTLAGSWSPSGRAAGGPGGGAYPVDAAYGRCMFLNKNFWASALTDEDIILEDVTLDHDSLSLGDGHAWVMRFVQRPQRRFARVFNCGSAMPSLACLDSLSIGCYVYNTGASYYDHWDGFGYAKVVACTGRNPDGRDIQQGIQFTGTGGYYEDRQSFVALSMGNQIYGCKAASGFAAAIICNVVDSSGGSSMRNFKSVGDYVENADIGIVCGGEGTGHEIHGLTLKNISTAPGIIQMESVGVPSSAPSNVVVRGIHFIDCNAPSTYAALQVEGGAGHSIQGLKFTGGTFQRQVWLGPNVSGSAVHPIDGTAGSVENVTNLGTGNSVYSYSGGGGGSASVVPGSDGSGPFVDYRSPNTTYRLKMRDNGLHAINGQLTVSGTLNAGGPVNASGYSNFPGGAGITGLTVASGLTLNTGNFAVLSGSATISGTLTCGGGTISLTTRQTAPPAFVGGETTDQLGVKFNTLRIALGNLGLIG